MKNKLLKSPLKVLAATSVSIFSLLTVFTSTAAWFDSRRALDNGANQMQVETMVDVESISIYHSIAATSTDYYFSQTATATYYPGQTSGNGLPMDLAGNPFSPLEPYHPILMVINYRRAINIETEGQVSVTAKTDQPFVCDITDKPSSQSLVQNGNPLSSIVDFFSLPYDQNTPLPTGNVTVTDAQGNESQQTGYHYGRSAIRTSPWATSHFAYMENSSARYRQSIEMCAVTSGTVNKIAVVMDYSEEIITYIYGQYIGASVLDNNVGFVCDWTLVV